MDISVFEVVGPVMMGPSSSGTAGMYRLGAAARQFFSGELQAVDLKFTPRFSNGYLGCRSHFGLLGGILGMEITDGRMPRVVELCKERGIAVTSSLFRDPVPDHALTVEITMENTDGMAYHVTGTSIGGGSIRLDKVEDFPVELSSVENHLFVFGTQADLTGVQAYAAGAKCSRAGDRALYYWPAKDDSLLAELKTKFERAVYTGAFLPVGYRPHMPLFTTFAGLADLAERSGRDTAELILDYEVNRSGRSREAIWNQMADQWQVMKRAAKTGLEQEIVPLYGYNDGRSGKKLMKATLEGRTLGGPTLGKAIATALATMEHSLALGTIVAAPTGGSAGIVPGTLLTVQQERGYSDEQMIRALFVCCAPGIVMDYKGVSFSGSQGGCQAEAGVSSSMAAAGLVYLGGGNARQVTMGAALAMKNILGLICDPLKGCDEVPCIKRNGIGVANAFSGADMALAGIDSFIPPDEVVDALLRTEQNMPLSMRGSTDVSCGACGTKTGLASWETTQKLAAGAILPIKE